TAVQADSLRFLPGSGRHHNQANTTAIVTQAATAAQSTGEVHTKSTMHSAITPVALHLALRRTQPPKAQSRSMGPNSRWYQSQACKRGELRAAAHAAIRINTVVGKPGTKIPITPSTKQSTANTHSSARSAGCAMRMGGGGGMVLGDKGSGGMVWCA